MSVRYGQALTWPRFAVAADHFVERYPELRSLPVEPGRLVFRVDEHADVSRFLGHEEGYAAHPRNLPHS